MKRRLFLVTMLATVVWKEANCTEISKAEGISNGKSSKQSRTDLCDSSSRRRFGNENRADMYYFCNKNKEGKWTMYSFTCPKNTFFVRSLEKCSRIDFPPVLPTTTEESTKEKGPEQLAYYSTAEPYVIHSWSESLKQIQNLINKSKADKESTTRKPSSVTTTTEDPWSIFFQHGLALSTAKPVSYGGSGLISSAEIPSLSTSTPPSLQKTKINSLSSVQVSTGTQKVTTEPTSTAVPLSKQDELVVRDFIIKNTKPLIPFPGSDNYIWSQPLFPSSVSDKLPLRLPLPLHSTKLPSGKGKPKLKVKLPMPKPTNGFSVQLLERFGVKLIPEDQFCFKRKPTLQNFTSTVYSSPEETTIYDPSSNLENPVNLPNHLRPLLLPPLWPSSDAESSRDNHKDSTERSDPNSAKSVSRKPRT